MSRNKNFHGCVFCAIVSHESPAYRVYEDDKSLAFLDIRPVSRGHTLVIPKPHSARLENLASEYGAHIFHVGQRIALALQRSTLGVSGAHLLLNDGRAAQQTVFHTHLHVIPRRTGDKKSLPFVWGALMRHLQDPESTAAAIRESLQIS